MNKHVHDNIERYLLNDMGEDEREKFESELVADDALFYETAERENELVDQYVSGGLAENAREGFEKTLEVLPARKKKVDNARAIHEFIRTDRTEAKTITIAERGGGLSRLGRIFSFASPAFQFASIALIILFALAAAWLLTENRRLRSFENELATARSREAELTAQVQTERDNAGDLTADLSAERERIARLEQELAALRRGSQDSSNARIDPPAPSIATLLLSAVGVRGGPAPVKSLSIPVGVDRVAVSMIVDDLATNTDTVAIRLNGDAVASAAKIRSRGGQRSVSVTIPAARFKTGRNEITLVGADGSVIASYPFLLADSR